MRVTAFPIVLPLLGLPAPAQETFTSLNFADGAGDVNRDGCSDLIVGRWIERPDDGDAGWVVVYSGKDGSVILELKGEQDGSGFGAVVAGVGDLNDDGAGDLAVGAPLEVVSGRQVGVVRVYSGRDGKVLYEKQGPRADELFGFSVDGAGDVDQDGMGDVIIGAPLADQQVGKKGKRKPGKSATGAAYVYSGHKGKELYELYGQDSGDRFGFAVDGAGDTDGDGFGELIVGAPLANYAILFSGSNGEPRDKFDGKRGKGSFGLCVSGTGDANQSGTSDFLVGAPWASGGGLHVMAGLNGRELWTRPDKKDKTGWWFGTSAAGAGDVDADGGTDVVVGDPNLRPETARELLAGLQIEDDELPGKDAGSGRVRVYSGKTGEPLFEIEAPPGIEGFGLVVGTAGDVNQDGAADILVGFPSDEPRAQVYSGRSHELLLDLRPPK